MDASLLDELFQRYISKSATEDEKKAFLEIIADPRMAPELAALSERYPVPFEELYRMDETAAGQIWDAVLSATKGNSVVPAGIADERTPAAGEHTDWAGQSRPRLRVIRTSWFGYAAAAILLFAIGGYLWLGRVQHNDRWEEPVAVTTSVIGPGQEGAILTLADGKQVVLDGLGNGQIALQNGAQVSLRDGQLAYDSVSGTFSGMAYNTMTTPKGRQFRLILPDGTKVWMNAASSIKYPTRFMGKERLVEATGEIYFEVEKDASLPFRVSMNGELLIEVIGTHFNINAYRDDPVSKTTLLEGRIRILKENTVRELIPGQQAIVDDKITIRKNVDLEEVMAWKNGFFNFRNRSLDEVMRMLSRWYDVDVTYPQGVPRVELGGKMGRDLNLDQVLDGLADLNVNYKLDGRTLVVLP